MFFETETLYDDVYAEALRDYEPIIDDPRPVEPWDVPREHQPDCRCPDCTARWR